MTRQLHRLNARQVAAFNGVKWKGGKRKGKKVRKPGDIIGGLLADGGNLYLRCDARERKSWQFIFKSPTTGKQRAMGLGSAGTGGRPLVEARALAAAARDLLRAGKDPIDEREADERRAQQTKRAQTFGQCADAYVESHKNSWRNEKHRAQWKHSLTTHCVTMRDLPVDEVDTEAVLKVLRPIWEAMPETATRLRGRIELVLDAARTQGLRSGENPAAWRGHLRHLLSKPKKLIRGHLASMPYADVPTFIERLEADTSILAKMLRFIILTASRSGEVRGLRWSEVDVEKRMAIVPGVRMKGGKEHRQPLSDSAIEVLKEMAVLRTPGCDLVFPSFRGRPFTNGATPRLLNRYGNGDLTTHGFRSSFRTWAAEQTSSPHEVIEMALAHNTLSAVERAYQRSDLAERRRALMDAWARHCAGGSNVVQLAASA